MNNDEKENVQNITSNSNGSPTEEDSFRQNASFAEKNLLNEGMFSNQNDEHDIKKISRKGIENMLQAVYTSHTVSTPNGECYLGRKGINQWIWDNKVNNELPTGVLQNYLHKKKKNEALSFYNDYQVIQELAQEISKLYRMPILNIQDKHIFNENALKYLLQHFGTTNHKQKLIQYFWKKGKIEGELETELTIEPHIRPPSKNIHPKISEFIEQLIKEGKARGTIERTLSDMNKFLTWLTKNMQDFTAYNMESIPFLKVKEMHLQEFRLYLLKKKQKGEYSPITVSECIYSIKKFFRFLKKRYGFPNSSSKLKSIKAPRYRYRELPTEDELTNFFNVINTYSDQPVFERIAFRLLLNIGLRSNEAAQVKWKDINLSIGSISIHSKGGKHHKLPLVGELLDDLVAISKSNAASVYLFGQNIRRNVKDLQNSYKLYSLIAGWTYPGGLHLFRHTFVTKLAENNTPPQALKVLTRVVRMDTVSLYTHLNQKQHRLTKAINKLDFSINKGV